ncbi:MAG: hypothetical protein R3A48_10375 [Polyangiales bacterium]
MSLFVVRPSRGTWGFFALVVLGVLGARAMSRHEARVILQDRPASEHAHELAACLLGSRRAWVLRDADAQGAQLRWTHDTASALRAIVSVPQPEGWPGLCVEPAVSLQASLLRASNTAPATRSLAGQVRVLLERASQGQEERLTLADNDRLASHLAALWMQVRSLSTGSRASWDRGGSHVRPFVELNVPELPRLRGLPGAVRSPVLADPRTVFARGVWNGYAQALRVDGGRPRRALLDAATPVPEAPRGPLLRAWRDDGPALFVASPTPTILSLPPAFAIADVEGYRWDSAQTERDYALLTLDGGTATLRAAEVARAARWTAAAQVGPGEGVLAAMLSEPRDGGEALRVTVLRPRLTDSTLEQHAVRREGDALVVGPAEPLATQVPLPGAFTAVETCRAGRVSYMAFATLNSLITARVEGGSVRVATARLPLPRGGGFVLRCDEAQALAVPSPASAVGEAALFRYPGYRGGVGELVDHPPGGPGDVLTVVLVRGGALAVVASPGAVRAWRYAPQVSFGREGSRWSQGAMLLDLAASPLARRSVTATQAASRGDDVTLLLDVAQSPRTYLQPQADQPMAPIEESSQRAWSSAGRAVLVSHDGGRSFDAPY